MVEGVYLPPCLPAPENEKKKSEARRRNFKKISIDLRVILDTFSSVEAHLKIGLRCQNNRCARESFTL